MTSRINRLKLVLASLFAVPLAIVSGAHALSSATARTSPELALAVWPSNGLARERLAYRTFSEAVQKSLMGTKLRGGARSGSDPGIARGAPISSDQLQQFAALAAADAKAALRDEPLLPKAHAILALAQKDARRREQIVALASRLNRRDLSLQGLVLESRIAAGDYAGTIATLDQILRVHPQQQADFFPVLTDALGRKSTTPAFREFLSRPTPWRDSFLMYAVRDPLAARNLAVIRDSVDFGNSKFDQSLIASLAKNGDVDIAVRLYGRLSKASATEGFSWSTAFPPFDWTFADQASLRAQLSTNGRDLEFAIDPGTGGVLASKLIDPPKAPFSVSVRYQLPDPSLAKDLKLRLRCIGQEKSFSESSVNERNGRLDIDRDPGCAYMFVEIFGRSWSGGDPLNGSITDVLIAAR